MTFFALVALWAVSPVASMDQLGIYRETSLSLFKTANGYLLNSASEGAAVLFDAHGNLIGSYRKQGLGPGEFHRQYVLKLDQSGIHFCSNGRFVMSFDPQLNPIPAELPNLPLHLPPNASFGLGWQPGSVLVALAGSSHLFTEVRFKGKHWEMGRQFFPTQTSVTSDPRHFLQSGKRSLVHHRTTFASDAAVSEHEDHYQIEVFSKFLQTGKATAPDLILSADVDEFGTFIGMRALITNIAKTPAGFVVELVSDMRRGGAHRRWHDHFSLNGQFQARINADGTLLLPSINAAEVFTIEDRGEDRVLIPLATPQ